jgi:CheY-like chemotaxis protein
VLEGEGEVEAPILVVEDELSVLQTIQWVLEDEGLPVATAANGREAVEVARDRKPALVVLDMALPILNGDGVAAELHRTYGGEVPILVITADGRAAAKAQRVGAYDYLQKPFNLDDLISAVQRGLTG